MKGFSPVYIVRQDPVNLLLHFSRRVQVGACPYLAFQSKLSHCLHAGPGISVPLYSPRCVYKDYIYGQEIGKKLLQAGSEPLLPNYAEGIERVWCMSERLLWYSLTIVLVPVGSSASSPSIQGGTCARHSGSSAVLEGNVAPERYRRAIPNTERGSGAGEPPYSLKERGIYERCSTTRRYHG